MEHDTELLSEMALECTPDVMPHSIYTHTLASLYTLTLNNRPIIREGLSDKVQITV